MNRFRRLLLIIVAAGLSTSSFAQFDESGIAAGFFDSSNEKDINFSEFHLPPLAVLFENAKASPQILTLEKAQELAQEGKKKKSAKLLYWLIQWTWGLAQNAIGLVVFALLGRGKTRRLGGAAVRSWNLKGSLSLGMFILMDRGHGDRVLVHEYGHTIQSLILGPLYLLVIGIPSLLWASLPALEKYRRKTGKTYYWLYCERWANYAGELSTGLASPEPSRARRRHPR